MLGIEITQQALFVGLVSGLVYAVLAAGFVLVYRCTGVLNFAQGEIGAFGVAVFALLAAGYGVPYWLSFGLAVGTSALLSAIVELTIVRRLFHAPRLVLLIATIGVAQLLLAGRLSLPDTAAASSFPQPFTGLWKPWDGLVIFSRDVLVLVVAPLSIAALALFMTRTRLGLMVRMTSSNPDTARVFGVSVKRTSTVVWTLAGAFAALTAIMIAPIQGITPGTIVRSGAATIGPALLVRALAVSLLARLQSLPMTIAGGIGVGIVEELVRTNVEGTKQTVVDVWLFVAVLVLVLLTARSRRDTGSWSMSARVRPVPERLRRLWYVRHLPTMGFVALFGVLALVPVVLSSNSAQFVWADILIFAMVALPITMLTGWAGQVSLGQFAFVGIGGLVMVMVSSGLDIPVPFDLWTMQLEVSWPVATLLGTAAGFVAAVVVGIPALRVRGLFLAIVTLAFAVAMANWGFRQAAFTESRFALTTPRMAPPELFGIDFADRRNFYYLCLVSLVVLTAAVARLRRTGIGRSMIAVRENEEMAAASTVRPARMKLIAFTLAGTMAAFAGCLFVTLRVQVTPGDSFGPDASLLMVATAVIGGLGSVAGPILGALWVRGLPAAFGDVGEIRLLTSGIGLLLLLLYLPGGLMQIVYAIRDAALGWLDRRLPSSTAAAAPARVFERRRRDEVGADPVRLRVDDVTVRFGGIRAVDGVSLHVAAGEVVGLIGTNGAGKSTLMNAISGFVPATGRIEVLGEDVSALSAPQRHRVGLGRGFQAARLYPDLTVRETVMVALEAQERSLVVPSITGLPPSGRAERRKRSEAEDLVGFLGLGAYGDQFVANLSTGTRRIVELACLLAVDARVLLLDEPTGGVAQRETEAFGPLLLRIREELDASMLVIEHDMPLIMSISDRVYCLEAGKLIAEGAPDVVRNDPMVVASYLGTDERAIRRSGSIS